MVGRASLDGSVVACTKSFFLLPDVVKTQRTTKGVGRKSAPDAEGYVFKREINPVMDDGRGRRRTTVYAGGRRSLNLEGPQGAEPGASEAAAVTRSNSSLTIR